MILIWVLGPDELSPGVGEDVPLGVSDKLFPGVGEDDSIGVSDDDCSVGDACDCRETAVVGASGAMLA